MALRKSPEPLAKVTLNLFASDVDRLTQLYTKNYTKYIRYLVRAHLTRSDAKIERSGENLSDEIDLEGLDLEP